jgi:hypothetical protein
MWHQSLPVKGGMLGDHVLSLFVGFDRDGLIRGLTMYPTDLDNDSLYGVKNTLSRRPKQATLSSECSYRP